MRWVSSLMQRGGLTIRFLGRRGMSPLIATVLLMAFAVALGGMIMNWSVDATKGGDCDRIEIKVAQLCSQGNNITLVMRNTPNSVALAGIKLRIIESSIDSDLRIRDSALGPGQPFEVSVPAPLGETSNVEILGMIGSDANMVTCSEPLATVSPIKPCS